MTEEKLGFKKYHYGRIYAKDSDIWARDTAEKFQKDLKFMQDHPLVKADRHSYIRLLKELLEALK